MKTRHKGFWRPTNQNFVFWPFMFSLENNKFWSAWRLEPATARNVTVDTTHWPCRQFYFKKLRRKFVYQYILCVWWLNHTRASFFCRFFIKIIKRQARAKNDASFILLILAVSQLLQRTDTISYRPYFIYIDVLKCVEPCWNPSF